MHRHAPSISGNQCDAEFTSGNLLSCLSCFSSMVSAGNLLLSNLRWSYSLLCLYGVTFFINFNVRLPESSSELKTFSSPGPRSFWPAAGLFSNTGSPRFTDFPSNLANLIGWEYETNTLLMLRKLGPARALDPCRRSEGSWLWGREWAKNAITKFHVITKRDDKSKVLR